MPVESPELHPLFCKHCGKGFGETPYSGVVTYCRDCIILPNATERVEGATDRKQLPAVGTEWRRIFCGMCGKQLGHARVDMSHLASPATFCSDTCEGTYWETSEKDPKGQRRSLR